MLPLQEKACSEGILWPILQGVLPHRYRCRQSSYYLRGGEGACGSNAANQSANRRRASITI
eukprot:2444225-Karenia_brevis.AAC.1